MDKHYYAKLNEQKTEIEGFYVESIHGKELCENILVNGGIRIDVELWQELLASQSMVVDIKKLSTIPMTMEVGEECDCYNINCKHCFTPRPQMDVEPAPKSETQILKEKVEEQDAKISSMEKMIADMHKIIMVKKK